MPTMTAPPPILRHGDTIASLIPTIDVYHVSVLKLSVSPNSGQAINILTTTHKVLNAMRDFDKTAQFRDTNNKIISLENFPSDKETFDTAFKTSERVGRNPQVMIGFTLQSARTFSHIKKTIFNKLVVLNAYIRPHLMSTWNSIDTVTVAHVHHRSPKFADLTEVRTDITPWIHNQSLLLQSNISQLCAMQFSH
jgi:hypothetical protein